MYPTGGQDGCGAIHRRCSTQPGAAPRVVSSSTPSPSDATPKHGMRPGKSGLPCPYVQNVPKGPRFSADAPCNAQGSLLPSLFSWDCAGFYILIK